mgnify:CR=1 FL=1
MAMFYVKNKDGITVFINGRAVNQNQDHINYEKLIDALKANDEQKVETESILNWGDMSTLSFHATKVYNTIEGGALIMHDEKTKKRIDYLKNFGFAGETEVVGPGINSKMDEMRSADRKSVV